MVVKWENVNDEKALQETFSQEDWLELEFFIKLSLCLNSRLADEEGA